MSGLLLPALGLLLAMLGGLVVLRLDTRAQRLDRRLAFVTAAAGTAATAAEAPRSIRIAQRRRAPLRDGLRRAMRVPVDLAGAHVIPAPLVVIVGMVAGGGSGFFSRLYFSLPFAIVIGIAVAALTIRGIFNWECHRYADRLRNQMPDMIELLASAVRAGLPVSEAFRSVGREMPSPTREEFTRVMREITFGSAPEEALMRLHDRAQVAEYAIFAVTLGVQSKSGGRLSETIQMLAETIRQRIALAARAGALAGEAKFSAYVLTVLPFLGATMMSFMQPGFLTPLFHDPRGQHMLFIGVALLLAGQFTMRRLIASATRD